MILKSYIQFILSTADIKIIKIISGIYFIKINNSHSIFIYYYLKNT